MTEEYASLAHQLKREIDGEVRFDAGSRALYSTDSSNYRQVPIGVVLPRTKEDVVRTVATCRAHDAPVLARGGGTSLAGQCCNAAVVMDLTKYYDAILEIDPGGRTARIQPGLILDDLRDAAGREGLTFGPDPATHSSCTLGGMMGNNACGVHSVTSGKTVDNVISMEVLTYDGEVLEVGETPAEDLERILSRDDRRGEIYRALAALRDRHTEAIRDRYPGIPRRVSGYNLDELLPEKGFNPARALVGSEGTCVTYLEATVALVEWPSHRALLVLGYDDVFAAADDVPGILEHDPIGLEGMDHHLIHHLREKSQSQYAPVILPEGSGWLLVEFGGDSRKQAEEKARRTKEAIQRKGSCSAKLYDEPAKEARVWRLREEGLGATARIPGLPDMRPGWEDSAVHPERLAGYLRDLKELFDRYEYRVALYGHFGDGCVHCRIPFDLQTADGLESYRAFVNEAAELCCGKYGGSLSGEHGDGVARGPLLGHMYSDELLEAMRAFKGIWDPEGRMNPGRIVEAKDPTEHLRLGVDSAPPRLATQFAYPDDDGDFSRAVLRCVGVGKCRRKEGGTMCPSYMATREEKHSTRGRARMLFEMLNGEEIGDWRDDHVMESLDLCLACKACKSDCPVAVDMATYKAEFLHHHYKRRIRPRSAYAMGLVWWWARLASKMPGLANRAMETPALAALLEKAGGIAPERTLPKFAAEPFTKWFRRTRPVSPDLREDGREVILWPDTFNNYFHSEVARAALPVLEAAGAKPIIPPVSLCCGRPLYDYGMLSLARRQLERILEVLRPKIREGVPLVGLEPSCVATFRDELIELFPEDEDARRLSEQSYLLSEWLVEKAEGFSPPPLDTAGLLHFHCHQKSVLTTDADTELLERVGLRADVPDTGCCGMAGAFGYEADKYDVSIACGERVLLPAVRERGEEEWIVTNGFSCREQIEQATGRRARHLSEVLAAAIDRGP